MCHRDASRALLMQTYGKPKCLFHPNNRLCRHDIMYWVQLTMLMFQNPCKHHIRKGLTLWHMWPWYHKRSTIKRVGARVTTTGKGFWPWALWPIFIRNERSFASFIGKKVLGLPNWLFKRGIPNEHCIKPITNDSTLCRSECTYPGTMCLIEIVCSKGCYTHNLLGPIGQLKLIVS